VNNLLISYLVVTAGSADHFNPWSIAMDQPAKPSIERLPEVLDRIGMGRSWLFDAVASGVFPPPVQLGRRAVGWRSQDIDQWIEGRSRKSK
jgi:prophage regulatory protein